MKEALDMMKKAMAMLEKAGGGSMPTQELETRMSPMPNEDGSSSSLGNSDTGGEEDDFDSKKQKKAVIMAAMKKGQ